MKPVIYILMCMLVCSSCRLLKRSDQECPEKVKQSLKSLSKYISFHKETKIYTLHHSKLPDITKERFRMLADSIESSTMIPQNYNMTKVFLYCSQLEHLLKMDCKISLSDIRKYFGTESTTGSKNGITDTLFYYFNNISYPNCYDKFGNTSKTLRCSLLVFQFDDKQILTNAITEALRE